MTDTISKQHEMDCQSMRERLSDLKRREMIDARYSTKRVGYKNWEYISKNISDLELLTTLFQLGQNNLQPSNQNTQKHQMYCGEETYLSIRPELVALKIVHSEETKNTKKNEKMDPNNNNVSEKIENEEITENKKNEKKQKNKKPQVVKKVDKMRQENSAKKIREDLVQLIKSLTTEPIISNKPIIFIAKFAELQLVKMMIQCRNLILQLDNVYAEFNKKSKSVYTEKYELEAIQHKIELYSNKLIELVVGYNKIVKEKMLNTNISPSCIKDLVQWIDKAKEKINFNASEVILNKPELIFKTIYDGMLEQKQNDLYPSQKEIFKFITSNEKYMALVHTMLGSGKTSMILPLCGWLTSQRKKNGTKTKILFCCPNEVVLLEVAHIVYGMAVPFAIVIYDQNENCVEYKWSSFCDKTSPKESAILYICDIFVARMLLEERQKAIEDKRLYLLMSKRDPINFPMIESKIPIVQDYIFVGDELTKDADSQKGFMIDTGFSLTTEVFMDITRILPSKIILMSSTLPTYEQFRVFYEAIRSANAEMVLGSFTASEAKIGCALISSSGELYAPHVGCTMIEEIIHILSVIKTNPFIGRFYTFEVLLQMVEIFKDLKLPVPDLAIMFDEPNKANQTNIQQIAYGMLETLIMTKSNELITKACQMKKKVGAGVDLGKIFTTDIGRFNRGCLIFSSDPITSAYRIYRENFDKFLDANSERTIFQQVRLDSILERYNKEIEIYRKALKRIEEKSDDGIIKQNKESNKKERLTTESWQKTSKMIEDKPVWNFPPELQICSIEHLKKVKCESGTVTGGFVGPEDLPQDTTVSMDILTMLASGIGIYSTKYDSLDASYLNTVLYLFKKGIIKAIFTDSSIAYGTNLAVSDIIMYDEPVEAMDGSLSPSIDEENSMKTGFQMLGRAGRGGNLSYEARIYTISSKNNFINKVIAYGKGTLDEGPRDELKNIMRAYETIWNR